MMMDSSKRTASVIDLWAASFLLLFFELLIIRWIPANVRLVAYFSNVVLISSFLCFGVGCILKSKRNLFGFFPWLVMVVVFLCKYFSTVGINNPFHGVDYFFGGAGKHSWEFVVPILFTVNALPFICIGQKLAQYLDDFPPLKGYSINILGSLVGSVCFAIVSFLDLPPTYWFIASFIFAIFLLPKKPYILGISILVMITITFVVFQMQKGFLWSPYYRIKVSHLKPPEANCYYLEVNDDYHQMILNLGNEWITKLPQLPAWKQTYDFPYTFSGITSPSVLVLGAGTGNDVAAALRYGAQHVEAVELDPLIAKLGKSLHPQHPYSDPRVVLHVNDARSYLRKGKGV